MKQKFSTGLKYAGYVFLAIAIIDYVSAALFKFDFWSLVGIRLEGLLYRTSAIAVGGLGVVMVFAGRRLSK